MEVECNICGSSTIAPGGDRGLPVCMGCGAYARTRVLWLNLEQRGLLSPGRRVLHIAPERALAPRLRAIFGDGYDPVDIDPAIYPDIPGVRSMDLCRDAPNLASESYDLILHSHVMEHIRCNVSAVLLHLHRAVRPGGLQLCCIPFTRGRASSEDLAPIGPGEARERFGQEDHVRVFGAADVENTIGMIFAMPEHYDLDAQFGGALLDRLAIPAVARQGWTTHSVLALAKSDARFSG